ncbi:DNA polymerase I, partial [termite gut metagenome]
PTFRHKAYEQYKAQREETPEAIRLSVPIIKDIINAYHIPILEVENYEADDVIGTLALQAENKGVITYMMTPDKDYGQLVTNNVFIYRPKYGDKEFEVMGVEQVKAKFNIQSPQQVIDMLGLMGDASDNIPGCPGVGEKTAQKLIAEYGNIENLLEHSEELQGTLKNKIEDNCDMIIFSKFLATIKTDVPIILNLDELIYEKPDEEVLRSIFEELEFKTLINRIFNKENQIYTNQRNNIQGDLFGFPAIEDNATKENSDNLKKLSSLDYDYQLVNNEEKRKDLRQKLSETKILSIDTETTGTDPINAELVGMSFSFVENQAYYVPVPPIRNEALKITEEFRIVFENENILKIGQNIKYDILVLQNYGIEVRGELFDTMVAHYVLQPELRHGMDYLAEIYLNYHTIHIDELIGQKGKNQKNMKDLAPEDVYLYACEDADVTLKLKNILEKELKKNETEELFYHIEMPLIPVLAYVERNGVRLDTQALKESSEHFRKRLEITEQEIYQLAGESFNIASPKQVGEILFDKLKIIEKAKRTKTGQYTTSEEVLESLRYKHPVVEKILEHRGLKKLLSTYVDSLPQLINPQTKRIHTSFNQTVTSTGRLSSSNPNLQNIPIRDEDGKEIRKAFIPDDECLFFSADYSQIELRIMAHLSEDKNMIDAFLSNQDIHAATAAKIYKIDINEVKSDMRRKAKTANFGIIYGISVFGLADRMNVERKEAKELIDGYFETYPQVKEYMDKIIKIAKENGYVETVFHRKRYLSDINSRNAIVRGYAERNAINAPIQGSAADIIKVAMAHIYKRFKNENIKAKMILQVHDELNFSVPIEEKEIVEKIVIEEMEGAYSMKVPLKADCGWGKNWLKAH